MGEEVTRTRAGSGRAPHLDSILSTQPELGPSIPDGGFGWIIFLATLFFQALIPSLSVSFGIFLAFSRLSNIPKDDTSPRLWDETLLLVPLFFWISRTTLETLSRALIERSTWPRLVGTCGTCLSCAGMLFMWMGMSGNQRRELFVLAGLTAGFGASLQLAQCEILLAQYFKLKLPILLHLSKIVKVLGFMLSPVILGHYILRTSLLHVILWYQAILLQGLVINIAFRKPMYLKSRSKPYQFVAANADDEEDIFSKNARELQIKRQTSTESHITTIEIEPKPSTSVGGNGFKTWEKFDDDEEEVKYDKLNEWEMFDNDDDLPKQENSKPLSHSVSSQINTLSLAEEVQKQDDQIKPPAPLFSDLPVNNNTTYAYDDEIRAESHNSNVFMPNVAYQKSYDWSKTIDVLKRPSFYKSLLMVIVTNFSTFTYFTLFPSYLYVEAVSHITQMTTLMGALCLVPLTFLIFSYCIKIDKKRRAICLWVLCWVGAVGYFMIGDFQTEYVLLVGAIQVLFSIVSLEHIEQDLLGLTIKGEVSNEYGLLKFFSGLSFLIFLFMDMSIKGCFHLLAVFHFLTGAVWLANYIYKKILL